MKAKRIRTDLAMSVADQFILSNQVWRDSNGTEWTGVTVARALFRIGVIRNAQELIDKPIGLHIDAGVISYERKA